MYRERSEDLRQAFLRRIKRISAKNLVYVDECGIDKYLFREYARALRGQKVMGKASGKKFQRMNIIAGICQGKWVAPFVYDCSTDGDLVEFWFENCLLKELKRGKFIVMDNASFHRKARLTELADAMNCKVIFLPSYSPDLNPLWRKSGLGSNTLCVNCYLFPILSTLLSGVLFMWINYKTPELRCYILRMRMLP